MLLYQQYNYKYIIDKIKLICSKSHLNMVPLSYYIKSTLSPLLN